MLAETDNVVHSAARHSSDVRFIFELNRQATILFLALTSFFIFHDLLPVLLESGFSILMAPIPSIHWFRHSLTDGLLPLLIISISVLVLLQLLSDLFLNPEQYILITDKTLEIPGLGPLNRRKSINLIDILEVYIAKAPASNFLFQTRYLQIKTRKKTIQISEANLRDKNALDVIKNILESRVSQMQATDYKH